MGKTRSACCVFMRPVQGNLQNKFESAPEKSRKVFSPFLPGAATRRAFFFIAILCADLALFFIVFAAVSNATAK